MTIPTGPSLIFSMLYISAFLFPIYILSHGFLFYSLCRVSHYMFKSLAEQIKREAKAQNKTFRETSQYWSRQMFKWKDQYNCITEFIDEINNCFGPFLLLATPCYFVRMVNNSFHLVGTLGGNGNLGYGIHNTLILIKDFIQLNFIAYTSHQIRQEASLLSYS